MTTYTSILTWKIPKDRGTWRAAVHGVTKLSSCIYIYAYTLHQFYSFIHRQNLRWFTYLGYMSDTAVKMEVQISHEDSVFLSFGYISKSSGHIVVIFLSF